MKDLKKDRIRTHIPLTGSLNTRHLGGYEGTGGLTRDHVFFRSEYGQLTQQDRDILYCLGVRTVIDLRTRSEELTNPNPFASDSRFDVHYMPLFDDSIAPDGLLKNEPMPMGELYTKVLDGGKDAFLNIFRLMINSDGGVLFHCTAGKDRTGLLAAILLLLGGVEEKTVVEEYAYTQDLLAPFREKLLQQVPDGLSKEVFLKLLSADPEYIRTAIRYLNDKYGGVTGYLKEIGMTDAEITSLRRKVI